LRFALHGEGTGIFSIDDTPRAVAASTENAAKHTPRNVDGVGDLFFGAAYAGSSE
jgi:hypothetical protein